MARPVVAMSNFRKLTQVPFFNKQLGKIMIKMYQGAYSMTKILTLAGVRRLLVIVPILLILVTTLTHADESDNQSDPTSSPIATKAVTKANLDQYMMMKTRELLETLRDNKELANTNYDDFYAKTAIQINTWVDSKRLTKGVLGKHYKAATEQEVDDFIHTMQSSLLRTYTGVLGQLVLDTLVIQKERGGAKSKRKKKGKKASPERDDRAKVRLSITLITGQTFPMQYSAARSKDGLWKIYNIIVGGVNLGLTYRNQFSSAMQDPINEGKIAKVIAGWDGSADNLEVEQQP